MDVGEVGGWFAAGGYKMTKEEGEKEKITSERCLKIASLWVIKSKKEHLYTLREKIELKG